VSIYRRLHDAAAGRDVSANLLVIRAVSELLDRLPAATTSTTTAATTSTTTSLGEPGLRS
jgi:hypothetical protein